MSDLSRALFEDYRLTTAEILYRMPDHPSLLQLFLWQALDLTPDFPELHKFLEFWERSIDGKLHSVKVASTQLLTPKDVRWVTASYSLH